MLKKFFQALVFLVFGLIGGMLWQTLFLPYLAENSRFEDWWFVRDFKERKVILYPREEIIIEENKALIWAREKAEKAIVAIETTTEKGASLTGSGLILTSDGLVVTLSDLVPRGSVFSFWLDNKKVSYEVIKRDAKENLALIRINQENLATVGFADAASLKKGQRVFLIGAIFSDQKPQTVVNSGIIKRLSEDFIYTNILEKQSLKASFLFDIQANAIGINLIGLDNEVITIPISKIQSFTAF